MVLQAGEKVLPVGGQTYMNHTEMLKLLLKMLMTKSTSEGTRKIITSLRVVIHLIHLSDKVQNTLKLHRILLSALKIVIHFLSLGKA